MKTLIALWNWFNGKKTIIGTFLIALAMFLSTQVVPLIQPEPSWLATIIAGLNWVGAALGSLGVGYKMFKSTDVQTK